MSDIEKRLAKDAHQLKQLRYSEEAQSQLERRISQTKQTEKAVVSRSRGYGVWLMPALAATLIVAVILWLPAPSPTTTVVPAIANVTPAPTSTEATSRPALPPIQVVDYATPLEQEWRHIQEDLATTRDKIEKDLAVQF